MCTSRAPGNPSDEIGVDALGSRFASARSVTTLPRPVAEMVGVFCHDLPITNIHSLALPTVLLDHVARCQFKAMHNETTAVEGTPWAMISVT
jgi:hypothetical protein